MYGSGHGFCEMAPWRRRDFTSRIAGHGHRSGLWRRPGWRGQPPGFSPLDRPSKRAPLKIFSPLDRPSKEVQNFYRKSGFRRPHGSRKRCDFCKSLILLVSLDWRRWGRKAGKPGVARVAGVLTRVGWRRGGAPLGDAESKNEINLVKVVALVSCASYVYRTRRGDANNKST